MNNLMSFEEFSGRIESSIKDYLPQDFATAEVKISENRKINESYQGLNVLKEGQVISPAINLNEAYAEYQKTGDIESVMDKIVNLAMKEPEGLDVHILDSYEHAKEGLFIRVCNAETNRDLLENVPHEIVGDLAVTCHVMVGRDEDGFGSTLVNYDLLDKFGISEEQLKADAMENSSRILSPTIESMNNVMARMMGFSDVDLNTVPFETAVENFDFRKDSMFVLTNTNAINGAAAMFYPEVMEQLGEHAGGDLFVIPSSVHEVLLVPDDGTMNRTDLENIIRDINAHEVDPKDRLSDNLYHYDSKDHRLERAVDFEERMEMEKSIARNVEKVSVKDKLKDAEVRVQGQQRVSRPARAQAIE